MSKDKPPENAVAIIGIACRFPGARNLGEFWDNLRQGRESITFFAPEELDKTLRPELVRKANYVRAKGKLEDADKFDAGFFGISPVEARIMDPQQRLLLELSWASLEDAGIVPGQGDNLIGVWVGTNWNRYYAHNVRGGETERRFGEFNAQLANESDFPATRISYKLNLTGPSITLATACSTSLVALGEAMGSLLNYECNAALAGGISVSVPLNSGYEYLEGGMLSADGHCRPFDAAASGTTFNDGAGVVTLKRLEDAVRDGDDIYAVVRGVGINNDGADKVSYSAPSVNGQVAALETALAVADVDPASVGFIEAHGTATPLGDPIEVSAIRQVYGDHGVRCALGSVKSNIGHTIHAAGIAGVIKAALSVRDGVIPPTVHFENPNPELDLGASRFFVNNQPISWNAEGPRRAAVSSFGVGGTNAHAIIEQAPAHPRRKSADAHPPLLLLSAKDADTVARQVTELVKFGASHAKDLSLGDVGYTLAHRRARFDLRAALFARSAAELGGTKFDGGRVVRGKTRHLARQVWAFPGQGAQFPGMGAGLRSCSTPYARTLDRCIEVANQHLDLDLGALIARPDSTDERISQTAYTQPALFAVGLALAEHYRALGLNPDALIGHSVGEFAAACLAGVFSVEDAMMLVCERGRLMQAQPPGSMLAVFAAPESLARFVHDDVCIAAYNSPQTCVLAGTTERIEAIAEDLRGNDVRVTMLKTSHAFHSPMMEGALPEFREIIERTDRHPPRIPIVSTATGRPLSPEEAASSDYWSNQLRNPVRFGDAVATLLADAGQQGLALLELGPGRALSSLFLQQSGPDHAAASALSADDGDHEATSWLALGALWCAGLEPPLDAWWGGAHEAIRLPTYPFRRDVHWLEAEAREPATTRPEQPGDQDEDVAPADLRSRVLALFRETTGLELSAADGATPFSEIGLDSLLLTQIAVAVQDTFDVVVTIKELVNNVNTFDGVFRRIQSQAPQLEKPDKTKAAPSAGPGDSGVAIQARLPRAARKKKRPGLRRRDTRPHSVSQWSDLGEHRSAALKAFIASHTARTAGSKAHIARHRRAHADPRTAAGYHRVWKEIVYPLVCVRSKGAELWDVDDNRYVDMLSGFGPNLLGHGHPIIKQALERQLASGMEIGPQSGLAGETAALVCKLTGMDRASFVCTGSEAVQAAFRCARTFTRRSKIVLFEGAYHGNFDEVLVRSANAPGQLRSIPGSPGIPRGSVADVIVLPWNHPSSLEVVDEIADQIAAVVVEPVQSRTPQIQPGDFLRSLREITNRHGALLVFDEVVTGFRCHPGGAQAYFGVDADLATYGKVAGGNMPIGIVAGRADVMDTFDGGSWAYGDDSMPGASVTFFAGTFVRHPLAIAACHAMLTHLLAEGPALQSRLADRAAGFAESVNGLFESFEAPFELSSFTSIMYLRNNDVSEFGSLLWYHLRHNGIFALEGFPSYLTTAHGEGQLDQVLTGLRRSLESMVEGGFLLEPRNLNREVKPAIRVPERAPVAGARLGQDPQGMPGWYTEQGGMYRRVPGDVEVDFDPFGRGELARLVPASESQQEVWFATQLGDDASCAFNESVSIRLSGTLDAAALEAALHDVVERHQAMRATLSPDGLLLKINKSDPHRINHFSNDDRSAHDVIADEVAAPFDLINGPLFRFILIATGDTEHTLVMTAHHVVCDGWSTYLLLKELGHRYRANLHLATDQLPPADELASYNEQAADLANTRAEDYWLDEFEVLPPVIDFPADAARPGLRTFDSARLDLVVGPERLSAYKALAGTTRTSLFALLLSGWIAYVARLTDTRDVVIGIPCAGQVGAGMPNLIGHCVNLLPVRAGVDPHAPFSELLEHVREKMTEALSHQEYTFGRLLKRLPLTRDPSRLPLIPMQFNLDPPLAPDAIDFGDLRAEVKTNPRRFENFEIYINIAEIDDHLEVQTQFNSNLFKRASIERRLDEYLRLLDAAALMPEAPVARLELMSPSQREALAAAGRGPTSGCNPDAHFLTLFADQVARHARKTAVRSGGRELSYLELDELASRLASCLKERIPNVDGSLIGVAMHRDLEILVALIAIWKVGAAYVPLDPQFPQARLEYMIEDAGIAFVVSAGDVESAWRDELEVLALDRLNLGEYAPIRLSSPPPETRAYVIYTSGSTGQPKGVEVSHCAVGNFLQSMIVHPGLEADDVLVAVTTLSFDIAVLELFGPLGAGATTVIAGREQAAEGSALKDLLAETGATVMQATPVTWRMLLEAGWTGNARFRAWCGGEAFPGELAGALMETCDTVFNMYGPTETTVWSAVYRIDRDQWRAQPEPTVPIGRPIHNTRFHVLDQQQQELPPGVPGELYIGGAGLALGYLDKEELTAQRFVNHPVHGRIYRTGDRVRQDPDGVVRFIGRVDSQVKVRGFRIELGEIESCLSAHPTVTEAVVSIYEPSPGDARVAAYCVAKDGGIDADALRRHAQAHLPQYMVPQYFVALPAIPLTPNRKADRSALPKPVAVTQEIVAPRNDAERLVVDAYKTILRLDEVGIGDDFFKLGGHSLLATRLTRLLEDLAGVKVPLTTIFASPVAAELAQHLAAARLLADDGKDDAGKREVLAF